MGINDWKDPTRHRNARGTVTLEAQQARNPKPGVYDFSHFLSPGLSKVMKEHRGPSWMQEGPDYVGDFERHLPRDPFRSQEEREGIFTVQGHKINWAKYCMRFYADVERRFSPEVNLLQERLYELLRRFYTGDPLVTSNPRADSYSRGFHLDGRTNKGIIEFRNGAVVTIDTKRDGQIRMIGFAIDNSPNKVFQGYDEDFSIRMCGILAPDANNSLEAYFIKN